MRSWLTRKRNRIREEGKEEERHQAEKKAEEQRIQAEKKAH